MDEYNRLSTENDKRLFLRNEVATHNIKKLTRGNPTMTAKFEEQAYKTE